MEPVFLAGLVFLGMKGFAAVVGAIAVSAILNLMTNDLTWTIAGVFGGIVLGFMAPDFYLTSKAGGRGGGIRDQLPDALDLLTISVEAGLGFDAAIVKVTEKMKGPLTEEFKRAAGEQRIGKSRQEALKGISERVEVKELQNFISAIVQADQLGVSMSKVLRIQSEQMRMERRQRAEEKAARAPTLRTTSSPAPSDSSRARGSRRARASSYRARPPSRCG